MATGEYARKRKGETRDDLTPQEAQIARLARDGLSNVEIAARIFVSQTTVAYHLRNVFAKLNIASRHQLSTVLHDSSKGRRTLLGRAASTRQPHESRSLGAVARGFTGMEDPSLPRRAARPLRVASFGSR